MDLNKVKQILREIRNRKSIHTCQPILIFFVGLKVPLAVVKELNKSIRQGEENVKLSKLLFIRQIQRASEHKHVFLTSQETVCHNHLEQSHCIGDKKSLLQQLTTYSLVVDRPLTEFVPQSFHIVNIVADESLHAFEKYCESTSTRQKARTWVVKPGENTNRGNGIMFCRSFQEVKSTLTMKFEKNRIKNKHKTYIVQQYIDDILLYKNRKFDIRCFMLVTFHNATQKAYWYEEGYIRTSSQEFNLLNMDNLFIHLTNDAIQKKGASYGKYEAGNKLSFKEFDAYMASEKHEKQFLKHIYPQMKVAIDQVYLVQGLAIDAFKSSFHLFNPSNKLHSFEIFGLDFMVDRNYKAWLIEINTNPCLEFSCALLSNLISEMLENSFRIGLDPLFPPPFVIPSSKIQLIPDFSQKINRFQHVI